MAWSLDARIPVTITDRPVPPEAGMAVLAEDGVDMPGAAARFAPAEGGGHPAACACCAGRSPAAAALDAMFQGRVKGSLAWFTRLVVVTRTEAGRRDVEAALQQDPLTAARYRK